LAVVFKKQDISQQVFFHNFHFIGFFNSNNQTTKGATTAEKSKFWNYLALDMLVVSSDIHVLEIMPKIINSLRI